MSQPTGYLQNFFQANTFFCTITGLWLYDSENVPKWKRYLQIFWVSLEYTIGLTFLALQFLILTDTVKDINKFFSHLGLLMSNVLAIFKVVILVFRRKRLEKVIDTLHDKNYQYEPVGEFDPARTFLSEKKFSLLCSTLILCLYTLVGVSAHISSAIAINKQINGTRFEGERTCQDFIPHNFFIPFEVDSKTKCHYALFFMDGSVCVFAWFVGCYDCFLVALLSCLKTQLAILRDAIKTIRKRVMRRLDMNENLDIFDDESLPELEEGLYGEFKHLVKHLILILSVAEEIEEMFNLMILGQTLTTLFNVASCLFTAAKVPITSVVFLSTLVYFLTTLVEFSLVCWFGSEITTASEAILFDLYDIDWFSASRRFKKALILTMCRVQRPIYLSIGKFFPLTLDATVSVCKASFSYYTVFRRVEE